MNTKAILRTGYFVLPLGIIVAVLMALPILFGKDARRINQARGDMIVQAIARYGQAHQRFPEALPTLVPTYLVVIPTTTLGRQFRYETDASYGYTLCFDSGGRCCYLQDYDIWDCTGEAAE